MKVWRMILISAFKFTQVCLARKGEEEIVKPKLIPNYIRRERDKSRARRSSFYCDTNSGFNRQTIKTKFVIFVIPEV